MGKLPRLDEVFLVQNRNLTNVGSAYSLKEAPPYPKGIRPTRHSDLWKQAVSAASRHVGSGPGGGSGGRLKPEFERIVEKYAGQIQDMVPDAHGLVDKVHVLLRDLVHEIEGAEGEDPAELDRGGPRPGTTGGR